MGIVDFILNLAGLLLWLNWRSVRFDPLMKRTPATLMGTLRPADPKKMRRWHLLALLGGLLFLRALVYRWMAPFWVGKLDFGVIVPPFRSDHFGGMLLFSFLSFGLVLGIFYVALLLLSLLKGPEPFHRLVKVPLGRVDDWSVGFKMVLPFLVTAIGWGVLSYVLSQMQLTPAPSSVAHWLEQSILVGLGSYLIWKFPLVAVLLLHLLNSYVYFGKHQFWNYVNTTAQNFLLPLKKIPLQGGKVDFAPLLGIALVFLAAKGFGWGLNWLFVRLPF